MSALRSWQIIFAKKKREIKKERQRQRKGEQV